MRELNQPLEYSGEVFRYKTQAEIIKGRMRAYETALRNEQLDYFIDIEEIFESL